MSDLIVRRSSNPGVQVNASVLDNPDLSMQAKGLYAFMATVEGGQIEVGELRGHFSNGRQSLQTTVAELVSHGCLIQAGKMISVAK